MIFLILDHNDLTGPIPPELGSLTELSDLLLGKSFLVILLLLICATNIHSLTWMMDFRCERLDRSDTFRAWIAHRADWSLLG
jgi:hypothetical protein